MTRTFLSLIAGALLFAPVIVTGAQAQSSSSLDRDPADTRIQGGVQPVAPLGSQGNRPVGRAIGRIGGNDEWVDRGGRPQSPDRTPSGFGTSGLAPNQGAMTWSPNSSLGTYGGSTGDGGAMGPAR